MRTLLILVASVSLSLASLGNAGGPDTWGTNAPGYDPDAYVPPYSSRVFYLVLENGIVHGDHIDQDGVVSPDQIGNLIESGRLHPYHYTAQSYSWSLVWLELLHEASRASVAIAEIQ